MPSTTPNGYPGLPNSQPQNPYDTADYLYGGPSPSYPGGNPNAAPGNSNPSAPGPDPKEAWYRDVIQAQPDKYDTNIPKEVWLSVYDLWNPKTQKFKSLKQNGDGTPQTGEVDKPWDCAEGTQAWGDSMCLPPGDPRLMQGNPGANPPTPPPAADNGIIESKAPATDSNLYDLQQALIDKFQGRQGIFGFADARSPDSGLAGDLYAKSLASGGLWWGGDKTMFDKNNAGDSLVPPGGSLNSKPTPAAKPPDVTGGSVSTPVMKPLDLYLQRPKAAAASNPLVDAVAQKFKTNQAPWWSGVGA